MLQCCKMKTVSDVIDTLGGPSALARTMGEEVSTVSAWKHRGRIPARHWPLLIEVAREGECELSFEAMFKMHEPDTKTEAA